jgi:iron complex transport system substrate-binding protein
MGLPTTAKKEVTTKEYILADAVWQRVAAVSNKKVYQVPALPFGWIDRPPSVNCLFGVLWLAKQLYPEALPFDLNAALKECFRLFYHIEITDEELENLRGF